MVAFLSGAVLTAANLNSAFNALTFRAVTGTSDTLVLADAGGAVSFSNASPITATVPPFSSVAYANGTVIQLLNLGAGVVTVTAGVGVTLNGSVVTLAQNAGGTLIKTATNTWYFLPSVSGGSGMDLITPTSVAGSGVTLSGAAVNFTAATTVSLNGVFSSSYENYFVTGHATDASVILGCRIRMRASSTDNSSANYDGSTDLVAASSGGVSQSDGGTGGTYASVVGLSSGAEGSSFVVTFLSPQLVRRTGILINAVRSAGLYFGSSYLTVTTQYDGFSFYSSGGTMSGTIRVYGLRNS